MKKVLTLLLCGMLVFGMSTTAFASSLDDVIAGNQQEVQEVVNETPNNANEQAPVSNDNSAINRDTATSNYINSLNEATNLTEPNETVNRVNHGLSKIISIVVQILAYAITAGLTLRVILDLMFIALPFTRSFLGNGYAGNSAVGGNGMGMQGGMGGMNGMGGMGSPMGGMGMGMNRMGMNRMGMNGMGMNGMGMNGMQAGMGGPQQQASMTGRVQLVSNAALNAVASEQTITPDGRSKSALKIYVADMIPTLVAVPVLLVLAMSGALTQLGLLLGEALAAGISTLGGMI